MKPYVSFLIPCFNYARYLRECLDSILNQSFTNFEVLILDDASTDETPELAREIAATDSRVQYYRHEKNIGHLNNYNFGIQKAQGELIWLISADDYLASGTILESFTQQFQAHPQLGYAFCRVQCMDEHSNPYPKFIPRLEEKSLSSEPHLYPGRALFRELVKGNFIPAPSVLARKACYQQYGHFHSELTHSGDWYNWLLFSLDWDVYYDPEPKVYYRKHNQNMHMTYQKPRHALDNSLLCYLELEKFLKKHQYPAVLLRSAYLAKLYFMKKNGYPVSPLGKLFLLYGKMMRHLA
ncbi:MAG: putative glycosyltransferase protein [Vampirovibrio sp.]|jgi:glycosyltransferase involved in cell wall biosynthesis|nr:putative glycosyltransferase protein [Vampirovibrio sp.]